MTPLSTSASLLLQTLRDRGATRRARALKDAELARATGIPQRNVIIYARELINAGYPVCATCKEPMGRFLVEPGDVEAMREAREEIDVLKSRGADNFARAAAITRALNKFDAAMFPLDSKQQGTLFEVTSTDPGRFTR